MSFAAVWMGLEIVTLSDVRQWETIIWYPLYVEYKKKDTSELIYKTEIDPQTYKKLMVTKGGRRI